MSRRESQSPKQAAPPLVKQDVIREGSPIQTNQNSSHFQEFSFKRSSTGNGITQPTSKKPKMAFTNYTNANIGQLSTTQSTGGPLETHNATNTNNSSSNAAPIDPDQLSDVISAVGLDLKHEEALLQSGIPSGHDRSYYLNGGYPARDSHTLLDQKRISTIIREASNESGLWHNSEAATETSILISHACEEWLNHILTQAIILSRHRRRSRNLGHSKVSLALRDIAIKDKEIEDKREERKNMLGLDHSETPKSSNPDDQLHRAANMTAAMMSSGKKSKYSWMTSGGSIASSGMRMGSHIGYNYNSIKIREVKEEPGVVLRDLLSVLENERLGVEKAVIKGYARLRN